MTGKEKVEAIIAAIHETFASVSRGNGISLHEADAIDDYASDERREQAKALDTDNHWWEVLPIQLEKFYSALAYMDAEGFRYYLPAYMTQALNAYTDGSLSMNAVLAALYPITDGATEKFALLDDPQKRSIAQFLWFIATEADDRWDNKLEVYNATRALEKIWYPYLSKKLLSDNFLEEH